MKAEISIQAEIFQWAWNFYPTTRRLLFHVPNGGRRSKIEAAQFKAQGVIAGIPDLIFIWKGKTYAFELKNEKGTLQKNQIEIQHLWQQHGIYVHVIRSLEQFQTIFTHIINS